MRKGKRKIRVLVTAGPTRAYLDRVRYLSNYSTGAMAFELCRALKRRGVEILLVAGPTQQPWHKLKLKRTQLIETNDEMFRSVKELCRGYKPDAAIFTAAVLDFAPSRVLQGKRSSSMKKWSLELKPTPKIIDEVGKKYPDMVRVGFKLEWKAQSKAAAQALAKRYLKKKKLDFLCLNYLSEIKKKSHPALLLSASGDQYKASTKVEIAATISKWLAQQFD